MDKRDLSFLSSTPTSTLMPLVITGECSGIATLMQKVTILILANANDPTRHYGGSLDVLLEGSNTQDIDILTNYFQQAADEVYSLLLEEQSLQLDLWSKKFKQSELTYSAHKPK